ncbi:hypothetical protein ABI582_23015 [Pseudomonas sp. SAS7]|uniref:PIN domain-containing protein n=1 Tax=Pseudomonas sp. SAS7 TaxID=3156487 RepID=UPI003F9C7232
MITRLLFQGRLFDHDTDDLVIDLWHPETGQVATQRLQMKRSLKPTDNPIFNESVGLAWEDFCKPSFRRNVDDILIVYHASSNTAMHAAQEVVRFAVSSGTPEDWYKRVHAEGFSNENNRKAYAAIRRAVELQKGAEVDKVELFPFALHLKFLPHDLDSDRTVEVDNQKQLISKFVPSRDSKDVWAALQLACAELNGMAGEITLDSAERHLGALALEFSQARALWEGYQAVQAAKRNNLGPGSLVDQAGALPLTAEAHRKLQPLLDALRPLLGDGANSQKILLADELPSARDTTSVSPYSRQLDRITEWQRAHRFQDCLKQLELLESDLSEFDDHQKARWYLLRGLSKWHLGEDEDAADDFDEAAKLCDSDDRIAAAAIRALMLRGLVTQAVAIGETLSARFPESFIVWSALANARIIAGEQLNEADVPSAFIDKAAAWQLVASSYAGREDDAGAIRIILIALSKPDTSFFIDETYLRYAIRLATADAVRVNCRSMLPEHVEVLQDAMARFDDRASSLWAAQSPKTVSDVVAHLAYAMVLLQRADEALQLIQEAHHKGAVVSDIMIRVEIEALCDLSRWEEVTNRFQAHLANLPVEALLRFGHACMAQSRTDLLRLAREEVGRRTHSDVAPRIASMLQHLHWDLALQAGDFAAVRKELEHAGVMPQSSNIIDLYFASRAYESDAELANCFVDRIAQLAPGATDPQELSLGARAMIRAQRHDEAVVILERLLPGDAFTPLHVDLLHCYSLTGRQAKARDLLQSMPATWRSSADAREQALFLYNSAGDWARMREVAELNVAEAPQSAHFRLMFLRVAACEGVLDFQALVAGLPVLLEGSAKTLLQLASIELRYGQVQKGLDRISLAMRCAQGDVEAAATHVQVMLTLSQEMAEELRDIERAPAVIAPGTSVELVDQQGSLRRVTLDLEGFSYPSGSPEFTAADSTLAKCLIGLRVGDTAIVDSLLGAQRFEIKQVSSVQRRLLEISHSVISHSLAPGKSLVSMTLSEDENGDMDFSAFIEQLEHQRTEVTELLAFYEHHPITLGALAKQLGRDLIDVVRGWVPDGPWLQISSDVGSVHDVFPGQLEGSTWVVDLPMLTELATHSLLDVLGHLPQVYVSTYTQQALRAKIEAATVFRKSGTLYSHEGQLGFHEESEQSHAQELALLEGMDVAISNFCTVVPAYGPVHPTPVLQRLEDVLDPQERACLTLCHEYQAGLLSLDGRLRQLAQALGITSASPQMLLKAMVGHGVLSFVEYSRALIRMIMARRQFISVNPSNLVSMMDQGVAFANAGINSLRQYLVLPGVIFGLAAVTVMEFVSTMFGLGRCTFVAMLELIKYLVEPLFRHADCPADFEEWCQQFLEERFPAFGAPHLSCIKPQLKVAKAAAEHPLQQVTLEIHAVCGRFAPIYRHSDNWGYLAALLNLESVTTQAAGLVDDATAEGGHELASGDNPMNPAGHIKTGDR